MPYKRNPQLLNTAPPNTDNSKDPNSKKSPLHFLYYLANDKY